MAERIRRLGPEDEAAARAVLRPAFRRYARALGREPGPKGYEGLAAALAPETGRAWGVEVDGRLEAAVFVELRPGHWALERLAATPEAAGRGQGARLLREVEAAARAEGAPRVRLTTASRLTGLVRLYEAHGYRVVRRGPPDHGLDAHERSWMELRLDQTVQS